MSVQENPAASGSVRFRESGPTSTPRISDLVDNVSSLRDIRASIGGDKLSTEAATVLALLISMPDPEVQTSPEFEFYVQQHGVKHFPPYTEKRTLPQLQLDLNKAHDNLKKQVHINTQINVQLTKTERTLGWVRIWSRILTAATLVEFGIIGWLISEFLKRY